MMRPLAALFIGVLGALAIVLPRTPGAWEHLRFRLGLLDVEAMQAEAVTTVKHFDTLYVRFFTSGGDLTGLSDFPAANLVKRRIVQDINAWTAQGGILSHDRMAFEFKSVDVLAPDRAVVVTEEIWQYLLRDIVTGSRTENGKINAIRVRYILRRHETRWRVEEFEVYGANDDIPPLVYRWGG
jgi:hypothetical protein